MNHDSKGWPRKMYSSRNVYAPHDLIEDESTNDQDREISIDKDNYGNQDISSSDSGSDDELTEEAKEELRRQTEMPPSTHEDVGDEYYRTNMPRRTFTSIPARRYVSESIKDENRIAMSPEVKVHKHQRHNMTPGLKKPEHKHLRRRRNNSFNARNQTLIPFKIYDFAFKKKKAGPDKHSKSKFENDPLFLKEFDLKKKPRGLAGAGPGAGAASQTGDQKPRDNQGSLPMFDSQIKKMTKTGNQKAEKEQPELAYVTHYNDVVRKKEKKVGNNVEAKNQNYIFQRRNNTSDQPGLILPDYLDIIDNEEKQIKEQQALNNPARYCPVTHNPVSNDYVIKCTQTTEGEMLIAPFGTATSFKKPTAIAIGYRFLIIASSHNKIYVFSVRENPIENLDISKEIESGASATCLDISENEEVLAIGCSDGTILIWNLTTFQKMFKLREHKASLINIRVYSLKPLSIVSSDIEGSTLKATFKRELLLQQVDSYWIFKKTSQVTSLLILNKELKNLFLNPDSSILTRNKHNEIIAAMAAYDAIYVVVLEPVVRILYKFKRPYYIKKDCNPSIAWASGVFNSIRKKVNNYLVIGWGSMLYLLELVSIGNAASFELVGHLPLDTDSMIIYICWISTSLLFVIDDANTLMVISLESFLAGEFDIERPSSRTSRRSSIDFSPSLQRQGSLAEDNESSSTNKFLSKKVAKVFKFRESLEIELSNQKNFHDSQRFSGYNNTIAVNRNDHSVVMLMKNSIRKVKLLTWDKYLDTLIKGGDWLKFLTLAVDIYLDCFKEVSDIPLRVEDKNELVHPYMNAKIVEFLHSEIISKADLFKTNKRKVHYVLFCIIDACLELNIHDFLYSTIWDDLAVAGFENEFLKDLEFFIKMNRVDYCPLPVLERLIRKYEIKYSDNERLLERKYRLIELLLVNLSVDKYENFQDVLDFVQNHNFLIALSHICLYNNDDPKYFATPFRYLIDLYMKEKEKTQNQVEKISYRIFWFLRQCFKGRNGFMRKQIISYKLELILVEILKALFEGDCLVSLMDVNSQMVINILLLLFTDEVATFIQSRYGVFHLELYEKYKCTQPIFDELQGNTHFQIFWLVTELILQKSKLNENRDLGLLAFFYGNLLQLKDYDEFFLDTNLCLNLAQYIVKNPLAIKNNVLITQFKFSLKNTNQFGEDIEALDEIDKLDNSYFLKEKAKISMQLIKLVEKYLKKSKIVEMLTYSRDSPLLEVTSYLYVLIGELKRSLQVYLDNPNILDLVPERVFEWIDYLMESLRSSMSPALREIKAYILSRINVLVAINVSKAKKLIGRSFRDSAKAVMTVLQNHPPQLKIFLDSIFDNAVQEKATVKKNLYDSETIEIYIHLLCKSSSKLDHEKLDFILATFEYPVERCLRYCHENGYKEAWAHLEKNLGNNMKALQLRYQVFYEKIQDFINNGNEKARTVGIEQLDLMLESLTNCRGAEARRLLFWILEKLLGVHQELDNYFNIPTSISSISQNVERVMETILFENVMAFSTIRVLQVEKQQIIEDLPYLHFLRSFYDTLMANYYHERHLKDSIRKIMVEEIDLNTNKLKKKGTYGIPAQKLCSKCQESLDIEEDFRFFGCGHIFHKEGCIEGQTCPVCEEAELMIVRKYEAQRERDQVTKFELLSPMKDFKIQIPVVPNRGEEHEEEGENEDEEEEEEEEHEEEDEDLMAEPGMRRYYQRFFRFQAFENAQEENTLYMYETLLPKLDDRINS